MWFCVFVCGVFVEVLMCVCFVDEVLYCVSVSVMCVSGCVIVFRFLLMMMMNGDDDDDVGEDVNVMMM